MDGKTGGSPSATTVGQKYTINKKRAVGSAFVPILLTLTGAFLGTIFAKHSGMMQAILMQATLGIFSFYLRAKLSKFYSVYFAWASSLIQVSV